MGSMRTGQNSRFPFVIIDLGHCVASHHSMCRSETLLSARLSPPSAVVRSGDAAAAAQSRQPTASSHSRAASLLVWGLPPASWHPQYARRPIMRPGGNTRRGALFITPLIAPSVRSFASISLSRRDSKQSSRAWGLCSASLWQSRAGQPGLAGGPPTSC